MSILSIPSFLLPNKLDLVQMHQKYEGINFERRINSNTLFRVEFRAVETSCSRVSAARVLGWWAVGGALPQAGARDSA